jgi:apolipoprotein N-acyltransferase
VRGGRVRERRGTSPAGSPSDVTDRTFPGAPSLGRPGATIVIVAGTAATVYLITEVVRVDWPSNLIGWLCLIPWLAALDRTHSVRGALAAGMLMSATFTAAVFPWFPQMLADYTGMSWPAGVALLLVLAPVMEPQFVTFALARRIAQQVPGGALWWRTALVGGAVYVGTEWAYPKLLADTLGHTVHASPWLRQAADLIGAHGLTFALIVGNECVLAVLRAWFTARRRAAARDGRSWMALAAPAACLALLVGGLAAYGGVRLLQLDRRRTGDPVTVAMIQGDISHYDRLKDELGTFEAVRQILDTHFALSAEAVERDRPDILIWPETVYPTTFGAPKSAEGAGFDRAIARLVGDERVPLVFGAYAAEGSKEFNAAFLLEPDADGGGVVLGEYRKSRLFPFTEYLPWPLDSDRMRRWMPWAGTWTAGSGPRVLAVHLQDGRRLSIAPLICYDALDPGFAIAAVRQGAELLVTLSNDSWFAFPGVQRLILIVSAFRSIETRRPQLRSTPTGVSAVIDETGAVLDLLDIGGRGILVGKVQPVHDGWTLMIAWGDWLPPAALTGSVVLLLAAYRRRPPGARAPRATDRGNRDRQLRP